MTRAERERTFRAAETGVRLTNVTYMTSCIVAGRIAGEHAGGRGCEVSLICVGELKLQCVRWKAR